MNLFCYLKKNNIIFLVVFLFFLTNFLTNCGRKNRAFFDFSAKQPDTKINRLTLPMVRGIKVNIKDKNIFIQWKEAKCEEAGYKLLGYNIYKFSKDSFIPKEPLNKKVITNTKYIDKNSNQKIATRYIVTCYAVRAVIKIDKRIFQGPTSKIVCFKNF